MPMLAEVVELVIGVDTHKHTHTAVVVAAATGALVDQVTVPATPAGYQQLLMLASQQPAPRVWAIEGTDWLRRRPPSLPAPPGRAGGGAGSAQAGRPPPGRHVRPAGCHPGGPPGPGPRPARPARATGHRAALSVRRAARRSAVQATTDAQRQLPALVVAAPDTLCERLRGLTTPRLVSTWGRLRLRATRGCRDHGDRGQPAGPGPPHPTVEHRDHRPQPSHHHPGPGVEARAADPGGWAPSWPPSCCVPGPIPAAAGPMPPSPCWAAPPPSRPPPARPSGCGCIAPGTATSTRPCTGSC
jgi:hypothetical protein